MTKRDVAERFWSKVDRRGPDECWPWLAGTGGGGYGSFVLEGRSRPAHCVAFFLEHGRWPIGLGCHTCNNRPCCNPAHVYDGTKKTNAEDAARAGVIGKYDRHGEKNPSVKLTGDRVLRIRRLLDNRVPVALIARRYGVTPANVRRIRRGETWQSVG